MGYGLTAERPYSEFTTTATVSYAALFIIFLYCGVYKKKVDLDFIRLFVFNFFTFYYESFGKLPKKLHYDFQTEQLRILKKNNDNIYEGKLKFLEDRLREREIVFKRDSKVVRDMFGRWTNSNFSFLFKV